VSRNDAWPARTEIDEISKKWVLKKISAMTKAEDEKDYICSCPFIVNSAISVSIASVKNPSNNPPGNQEDNMSHRDTSRPSSLDAVVQEYAFPDVHIGPGEDESPYVPYVENVFIRHLAFDVRNNMYANILWVKKGGRLNRHRHRGRIFACTLEGSWRYLEYDWVARAGSYVQESPGAIHTLVSDDPNGMKTIFWLNGAIEFFDDDDNLLETLDVFWFINHYVSYCSERGIPINKKLWV
jgi:2,4'-dihydroxyacetophenone dioxygenase